jgi:enoyl-CoA hydratase
MTHTCFAVDVADHVAHVRMIRPERANSMIPAFWSELPQIVDDLSESGDARVIVLSAEGRHFCSGMDLTVFGGDSDVGSGAVSRAAPGPDSGPPPSSSSEASAASKRVGSP